MSEGSDATRRKRLRNTVWLLLLVAAVGCGVASVHLLGPSPAILAKAAADHAAWEQTQTIEQRRAAKGSEDALSEIRRDQGLMVAVFLLGNLVIIITFIRSTRANARALETSNLHREDALAKVLSLGARSLGAACALLVVVPIFEKLIFKGSGMYHGMQSLVAIGTLMSFVFVWTAAMVCAWVVLRKRRHVGQ